MRFGFHVSIAGGLSATVQRAVERRCSTLQIFTSAPTQWARRPLPPVEAAGFAAELTRVDIRPLFVHAIYLPNLASPDQALWRKSRDYLAEELRRARMVGASGVILHLGSAGPEGDVVAGRQRLVTALDDILAEDEGDVSLILENSATKKEAIGCRFEDIGEMIAAAKFPQRLQVCMDTAHAFAHGYPIHTHEGLSETLDIMDASFGLEKLAVIHANDSRGAFASGLDRHWHIGEGHIGSAGFQVILNEPRLRHLPFIMETPNEADWDTRNMRAIRRLVDKAYRPELRPLPRRKS